MPNLVQEPEALKKKKEEAPLGGGGGGGGRGRYLRGCAILYRDTRFVCGDDVAAPHVHTYLDIIQHHRHHNALKFLLV